MLIAPTLLWTLKLHRAWADGRRSNSWSVEFRIRNKHHIPLRTWVGAPRSLRQCRNGGVTDRNRSAQLIPCGKSGRVRAAAGAGLGGFKMARRVGDLEEFKFLSLPVKDPAEDESPTQGSGNSTAEGSQKGAQALQESHPDTTAEAQQRDKGTPSPTPKYTWLQKNPQAAADASGGGAPLPAGDVGGGRDGVPGGSGEGQGPSVSTPGVQGSFKRWGSSAAAKKKLSSPKKAAQIDMQLRSGFRPVRSGWGGMGWECS